MELIIAILALAALALAILLWRARNGLARSRNLARAWEEDNSTIGRAWKKERDELTSKLGAANRRVGDLETQAAKDGNRLSELRTEIARLKPLAAKAEASQRQRVAASHARVAKLTKLVGASSAAPALAKMLAAAKAPPPAPAPKRKARAK